MAESVVKIKLVSSEYDSKIKRAAQNVLSFGENCRKAGQSMEKADKETIEYVQSLGRMETVAKNAKGKVNEMTTAFTDLSVAYKNLSEQDKQSQFGKSLSQSLEQLKTRIHAAKEELSSINDELTKKIEIPTSGGLGGRLDGMLAVFGGNMMTKAAGLASGFASGIADCVKEGIELAKAGEGVRIAFERLNRPDLLDNLREATHGTVTDIELMRQAVKFNDFKLSLDDMGTLLSFAQQKAKDTGESVDYMVDSIVTGLGRQSLMILDNLGISANEVKEKMKGTGDMTKAVAEIIRDQMSKAGDYIETAADRAAKADVEVKNAMEELGRTFQPLADAGASLWHSLTVGALNFLNSALLPVINAMTQAGRARVAYGKMGGSQEVNDQLSALRGSNFKQDKYNTTVEKYNRQIYDLQKLINNGGKMPGAPSGTGRDVRYLQSQLDGLKKIRDEYIEAAKEILNPTVASTTIPAAETSKKTGGRVKTGRVNTTPLPPEGSIAAQEALVQQLTKAWREASDEAGRSGYLAQLNEAKAVLDEMQGKVKEVIPEGSFKALNQELHDLQSQRELLSDPIDVAITDDMIQQVKDKIDELNGKKKEISEPPQRASIEEQIRTRLSDQNIATDATTFTNLLEFQIKNGLENIDIPKDYLQQAIFGKQINIPDEYWQDLVNQINAKLLELGKEPIKLNVETGEIEKVAKKTKNSWNDAANAIMSVGSALQQLQDPAAKIAGIVGEAIATIALAFAQASAKETKSGIWGWIAATAVGLGTMISTITAIKSATAGSYAEGGIIPGNNYNDGLIANVSSGELILNRAQQANIAGQLTNNGLGSLHLEASLDGEDIRLAVRNGNRRRGRGEYVESKSR